MVRHAPCRSQRRPEVTTRAARHAGRPARRRSVFDKATSSISGIGGKPPAASNNARVTNIAWSPVAMPVTRERRFIIAATHGNIRETPAIVTSKRPHGRPAASARAIACAASSGRRVSAWRNNNTSPCAAAAPAFIWRARPRGAASAASTSGIAISSVRSPLPPSTTMTSCPAARKGCSTASAASMSAASSSTGTMIESRSRFSIATGASVEPRAS